MNFCKVVDIHFYLMCLLLFMTGKAIIDIFYMRCEKIQFHITHITHILKHIYKSNQIDGQTLFKLMIFDQCDQMKKKLLVNVRTRHHRHYHTT